MLGCSSRFQYPDLSSVVNKQSPFWTKPRTSRMDSYLSGGISMNRLGYIGFMQSLSFLPSTTRRPLMTVGRPHLAGHSRTTHVCSHFRTSAVTKSMCALVLR